MKNIVDQCFYKYNEIYNKYIKLLSETNYKIFMQNSSLYS